MNLWLFPDTTVLCNFAAVEGLPVLKGVLSGRGRWTQAVAYEVGRSANAAYADLETVIHEAWLGEPIETTRRETPRVDALRRQAFGPTSRPTDHLGEAETLFVILNREGFRGSFWLSEDRPACDFARRQGITVWDTMRVLEEACADGDLAGSAAFELITEMHKAGRHLHRFPTSPADFR